MPRAYLLGLVLPALLLTACDTIEDNAVPTEVVVESYQVALEPLQPVRLSRLADIDDAFRFADSAINNAEVQIDLLAPDGSVETTYTYQRTSASSLPGHYSYPTVGRRTPPRVLPLRQYRLTARIPDTGEVVTSTTLVPDTFRVVTTNLDTVRYQREPAFEVQVTQSTFPGRQNIFIFTTTARNPARDNLTAFYAEFLDDEADVRELETTSSPPLFEGNYTVNADGTINIRLPWLAVAFYGTLDASINVIDDNLYDFIRSQQVQQGGSTLGPGEIPNVLDRVENGTGVFGSFARITEEVHVLRE
ncbi:MAG: DUF4249 family protein [Bacteroidota bacterium]